MKNSKKITKVAIVHDTFLAWGGAERVLVQLVKMFPQADVYVPLIKPSFKAMIQALTRGKVRASFLNALPLNAKYASLLKPVIFYYWEHLDLKPYELVISSSHSFSAKSVMVSPSTKHISYIHTPPRYLYSEFNEMTWIKKPIFKLLFGKLLKYLKKKDFEGAQRPNLLVANSQTVRKRIKKYYGRESRVIYPPVNIPKQQKTSKLAHENTERYYLCVSRLVKQKGIDLAIKTCTKLGKKLLVVGTGPEEQRLKQLAGPTVTFLGFIPDSEMANVYAGAKALLYCSLEEDFGLVPVEAMAHGVPVIGYHSGGVAETVVPHKTGLLFQTYSTRALENTILQFERLSFSSTDCRKQAQKFSKERFVEEFMKLV